ncbi:MAG TPA: dienelactone hydrolase family protein [Ktedonosporobacter sp.]|nr:dienelactone hydrolase family protein [Ktedonosporobacter sp.]
MSSVAQSISFPAGSGRVEGYLVRPEGDGPFPGVVVIHEIFGLNENIKEIAQRFADQGYVALAVDLFAGHNRAICMFRFMGQIMLNPLKNNSIRDLKAALTYLTEQPGVDSARLGAIGFCMGGSFAVSWACSDNRLRAIAPFYGMNPRPLEAVARACPVVGSYPDKDFTTSHGQKLDVALNNYNIPHDIKVYPNSKHSFFNDKGSNYNEEAAKDSWQRIITFFSEHIG